MHGSEDFVRAWWNWRRRSPCPEGWLTPPQVIRPWRTRTPPTGSPPRRLSAPSRRMGMILAGGLPFRRAETAQWRGPVSCHAHSAASSSTSSPKKAARLPRPELLIQPALPPARRRGCPVPRYGPDPAQRCGPSRQWSKAGAQWRSRSCLSSRRTGRPGSGLPPRCPKPEVASSRIRIGRILQDHPRKGNPLALCPPDSFTPRSPTCAS